MRLKETLMPLTIDLSGTVTLVTGVTSGIGRGIGRIFAQAGSRIVGCARHTADSPEAEAFRSEVESHGSLAHYISCDTSTEDGPAHLVSEAIRRFQRVDYVASNAGRNVFTGVDNSTLSDWDECMRLNLRSHWLLAQAVRPYLFEAASANRSSEAGSPVFLVNTSNHADATLPGCFPYNVAKAGLKSLVQSLAIEWGPTVRSFGVAPGFIETEANEQWFKRFADPTGERARTEAAHPVGRLGTTEEIGALFTFLASRYAEFMSGTTVIVDGGRSALMQDGMKEFR
jgi:NAD(P)-dependent dehydrogenase (short-subunit alcohol dehydrogenase family)